MIVITCHSLVVFFCTESEIRSKSSDISIERICENVMSPTNENIVENNDKRFL